MATGFSEHPYDERTRVTRTRTVAVSTRLERILTLYGEGKLDEESLAQLNRRLRRRQDAIREQLATLEAPLEVDFTVNHERLRAFLADMERWIREGDVVRRKTLLREVYQEIRIWPKTATKPWTRKVFVAANLDALTRFWMVPDETHPERTSGTGVPLASGLCDSRVSTARKMASEVRFALKPATYRRTPG